MKDSVIVRFIIETCHITEIVACITDLNPYVLNSYQRFDS